jgi:hypothetical protein
VKEWYLFVVDEDGNAGHDDAGETCEADAKHDEWDDGLNAFVETVWQEGECEMCDKEHHCGDYDKFSTGVVALEGHVDAHEWG